MRRARTRNAGVHPGANFERDLELARKREGAARAHRLALEGLIKATKGLEAVEAEIAGINQGAAAAPRKRRPKRSAAPPAKTKIRHTAPQQARGGPGVKRPRALTWTTTMHGIVARFDRGIEYPELRSELGKTHLADRLLETDNSFYGGIKKLLARKLVVYHKGRLFSPKAFEKFRRDLAAGRVEDIQAPRNHGQHSAVKDTILAMVAEPDRYNSGDIIEALERNGQIEGEGKNKRTAVYNLIGRMVGRGELVKNEDGTLRLPSKKNGLHKEEAPDAKASRASH